MDQAAFWSMIDRARNGETEPQAPSADPDRLQAVLDEEPDRVVQAFAAEFGRQLVRLNRWLVWGAGYVIAGGMSDDGFHYFRSWLIGKGKAAVEQALSDPDGLGRFVVDPEEVENETLEYAAVDVCEARGLEDPRNAYEAEDAEPDGHRFDEEAVYGDFPRLAARFG